MATTQITHLRPPQNPLPFPPSHRNLPLSPPPLFSGAAHLIRFPRIHTHCLIHAPTTAEPLTATANLLVLRRLGLPHHHCESLLQNHPDPTRLLRFLTSSHKPPFFFVSKITLLLAHGVPLENLGWFLDNLNLKKIFHDKTLDEVEGTILYLKSVDGFSWLLRRPQLLNLDLTNQLAPRIEFLTALSGGDREATKKLIGKLPYMLAYSVDHYRRHLAFWRSVGISDEQFFNLAVVYPNVFSISRDRKLQPRVAFLTACGLTSVELHKFLTKAPLFLSLSFRTNLSQKLGILVKIGFRHGTREFAAAAGAATRTSAGNMQKVVGALLGWGLSCEDVVEMCRKQPQVLQYNHGSLVEKVEYLVGEMGRDVGELLAFPAFLGYKLDGRIKRRYEAKRESRGKGLSINKLLTVSADRFFWNDDDDDGDDDEQMEEQEDGDEEEKSTLVLST